jgi:hypothetical protein
MFGMADCQQSLTGVQVDMFGMADCRLSLTGAQVDMSGKVDFPQLLKDDRARSR